MEEIANIMDRSNLVEIKRGQTGTGLLIENDGYISMDEGENREFLNNYRKINEVAGEPGEWHCPFPFVVSAVFQKFGIENANGRIYPEGVLKREVEKYQKLIDERSAIGELNHPSESVIDLERVAINILELHWVGHTLVGKMEILISEAFRKYGMITCCADHAAHLLLSGIKIGVSSRGLGTVTQRMGVLYVADDYEIVCWDVVSSPSTPGAYIAFESEKLQQYVENDSSKSNKNPLLEKLDRFSDWLND